METSRVLPLLLFIVGILAHSSAKLILGMTPCPQKEDNFNECVLKNVDVFMRAILKGESVERFEYEPFNLNLTFDFKKDDLLSLHVEGKRKSLVKGLENTVIRNFNFDIDVLRMSFDLDILQMRVDTPCTVEGYFGNRNYKPNEADGIILHVAVDRLSATFEYRFVFKTNSSGRFLVPSLSFHNTALDSSTFSLENLFPADNPASVFEANTWKAGEESGSKIVADVFKKLVEKIVSQTIFNIMQMNTYDELYPGGPPAPQVPGSAASLTGCLALVVIQAAVLLRGV